MHEAKRLAEMAPQCIIVLLTTLLFSGFSSAAIDIHSWTYLGENGTTEEYWPDISDSYCDGSSQSPIDIDTDDAISVNYEPFDLDSYHIKMGATLENNGHSLKIDDLAEHPSAGYYDITGGGLRGTYRAYQFHFHFGSTGDQGSEHTVDARRFPAEMHIVHYNSTAFSDPSEALKHRGGIAVLGFLLEEDEHNTALDIILNNVHHIKEPDEHYAITDFMLSALLPSSYDKFWRYNGSLTTPLCNEVVTWTLFRNTITISSSQLNTLRTLMSEAHDDHGNQLAMADNYRSIQDKNGRAIYDVSTDTDDDDDGDGSSSDRSSDDDDNDRSSSDDDSTTKPMITDSAWMTKPSVIGMIITILAGIFATNSITSV